VPLSYFILMKLLTYTLLLTTVHLVIDKPVIDTTKDTKLPFFNHNRISSVLFFI